MSTPAESPQAPGSLDAILNCMPDPLFVVNSNARVVLANPAAHQMLGTEQRIVGCAFADLLPNGFAQWAEVERSVASGARFEVSTSLGWAEERTDVLLSVSQFDRGLGADAYICVAKDNSA